MKHDNPGAGFGAMTEDEQVGLVGGDGGIAATVGWYVGYAMECMLQAIVVNSKIVNGQTVYYVEGRGWF